MTNLLYAGLSASVLIGIAGLLRLCLGKKIPSRAFYLLWRVLLLRLLFPFSIPIRWRSSSQPSIPQNPTPMLPPSAEFGEAAPLCQTPPSMEPVVSFHWSSLFWGIWLAGAILLATGLLVNHLRWRRVYAQALPVNCVLPGKFRRKIQVRVSDQIQGPLTYGLVWPVILLPQGTASNALPYVLAHEAVHIRRLDNGFQWLLAVALCLHWMNPLVWVLAFFFRRDIELSCDEAVLHQNPACQKAYAWTLLAMAEGGKRGSTLSAGFSKHPIQERIVSIMNFKPNTLSRVIIAIAAVMVVSLLSVATIFRPAEPQDVLAAPEDAAVLPSADSEDTATLPPDDLDVSSSLEENLPENTPVERQEGEPDVGPASPPVFSESTELPEDQLETDSVAPPSSQENSPEIAELPEGQLESGPIPDETAAAQESEIPVKDSEGQSLILPVSLTSTGHHGSHHDGHHNQGNHISCYYDDNHCGIDIACPTGTAVCAAGAGTVVQSGWDNYYGHCVVIDHGNGIQTRYGHNSQLLVAVGDVVSQGQQIAQSGNSGMSTGPHCHYEVLCDGSPCDPFLSTH